MNVAEAVATRRSVRAFLDTPVPLETIKRVLDQARMAPSGCNYQPWEAIVLTGAPLKALQDRLSVSERDDPPEYDFSAPSAIDPKYHARLSVLGRHLYGSMGSGRGEKDNREAFARANMVSFGAPVLLLCHFPKAMKEAQWSDTGMWLQTIMLLLRGEGLDSCAQEYMGVYGRSIKDHLGLSDGTLLFCGIAIGHRDPASPANNFERERVPLDENIRFEGF
ncbi:nitroreductase [Sphingomonas montanisoli]|uniref:Nitroreductase n=1 Tax=Sphingomonas montanisoli TaxID=2606412 RepID=A0A5D9CFE3_9SPHN|nr:nitroreductase [Sphingomonas montanisoli]TZG28851.1 nitroreductase [Sphingomonas montanisoli]